MATGFTYRHYILKDHLGSWTTITDAEGNVEQELSFDAWGTLRDPETWTGTSTEAPMFDRGFTGHEHLRFFDLINMNGRMYDPVMSTFLSVDAYVQDPSNAQNFNRYAYCLNNPLKYTDPSGWFYQGGSHSVASDENARRLVVNSELYAEQYERFFGQKENHKTYYMQGEEQLCDGGGGGGSETPDDDWIYDESTGEYVFDNNVHGESTTPAGYEYVGPGLYDVVLHDNEINGPSYDLLNPNYEESNGEISAPKGLANIEMALTSNPNSLGEAVILAFGNIIYGFVNSPYSLLTGCTLAGSKLNSQEKVSAFVDVVPGLLVPALTKSKQVIMTTEKSLNGYNQFVKESKKAGVIFKGKDWQKEAGRAFQKNRVNQNSLKTFEKSRNAINHGNSLRNEYNKYKY